MESEAADCHAPPPRRSSAPLSLAFLLTAVIFVVEFGGGLLSGSLALLADATHMAVDLAALGIGLFAAWAAGLPPDRKRTFGYHRMEVLAALINGVALWMAVGVLLREAWGRFQDPHAVKTGLMLAIALVGLLCNLVSGAILFRHRKEDMNLRAVFLHVMSDALGSLGALAAGLVIRRTGRLWADPLATVFICVIICSASFNLIRDSIHILLEGAPAGLDVEELRGALREVPGVSQVHDLHLWCLSQGQPSMSGHLILAPGGDARAVLRLGQELLERRFGIGHTTLQIETQDERRTEVV